MDNEVIEKANSMLASMAKTTSARSDVNLLCEIFLTLNTMRSLSYEKRVSGKIFMESDSHVTVDAAGPEVKSNHHNNTYQLTTCTGWISYSVSE